jgi:hypothetical protein
VSRWEQIHRHFPPHALLAGYLYARWLRSRRWLWYLLGGSRRRWQRTVVLFAEVRIIE